MTKYINSSSVECKVLSLMKDREAFAHEVHSIKSLMNDTDLTYSTLYRYLQAAVKIGWVRKHKDFWGAAGHTDGYELTNYGYGILELMENEF